MHYRHSTLDRLRRMFPCVSGERESPCRPGDGNSILHRRLTMALAPIDEDAYVYSEMWDKLCAGARTVAAHASSHTSAASSRPRGSLSVTISVGGAATRDMRARTPCWYKVNGQVCPFGFKCWFNHSVHTPSPP